MDWNLENKEGVLAFSKGTEVQEIFTLTFLILEGTEDGEVSVECQVVATEQFDNKVDSNINLSYQYGIVNTYNAFPGDMDGDDIVDSDDVIYLLYHVMLPDKYPLSKLYL